jgi:beta-glucosidase-like glycosyl hydrolase
MTLERAAAACVWPGFPGLVAPDWLLRRLGDGLGGVVLFAWNVADPEQLRALTGGLGDAVVAIDEEGGDVTRLEAEHGSSYPGNLALGAIDDVDLTREVARAIGGALARAGVTMNLAPVADVNTNPRNPIVGVRSFGSEPALVARHVAAFVEGTQAQGVAACAKHFPGHGDVELDSHLELPTVAGDVEAALEPFRAAVAVGVRAIMTGHLLVPALDPGAPASLSRPVTTELLRERLGFDGVVVTDALEMRGASGVIGMPEAAVRALAAGADALCLGHDSTDAQVGAVLAALLDAVRSGRLPEARVHEAAARVAAVRAWASPAADGPGAQVGEAAARRALAIEGDVRISSTPLVIELSSEPTIAAGPVGYGFGDAVRRLWPDARCVGDGLVEVNGRPIVLVLRDAGRRPQQQAAARELIARRPDTVVVETGYPAWRPAGARGYVTTRGAGRVNLDAAAAALAAG